MKVRSNRQFMVLRKDPTCVWYSPSPHAYRKGPMNTQQRRNRRRAVNKA